MSTSLQTVPARSTSALGGSWRWTAGLDASRSAINEWQDALQRTDGRSQFTLYGEKRGSFVTRSHDAAQLESKLFDALVKLKVAVAKYAMHISSDERHRIFEELDSLLNCDDWHEGDTLPAADSLVAFLKWSIYSKRIDWTSLGVSNEGHILVAWRSPRVQLTAAFAVPDEVKWTARVESKTGIEHAAGKSSLQYFAKQFSFVFSESV
jgi:hypothetical protein